MKAGTHQVNTSFTRKISLLAGAVALSGCATLNDAGKNYGTAIGCAGGALLGAGLTYAITGDAKKAIVGGGVGAAAGCVAGNLWQNRLQELERIAKEENLNIQVQTLQSQDVASGTTRAPAPTEAGIVAQVQDEGMFATGSAQLSANGQRQVRKLAAAFAPKQGQNSQAAILVVGHTDATERRHQPALSEHGPRSGVDPGRARHRPSACFPGGRGFAAKRRQQRCAATRQEPSG